MKASERLRLPGQERSGGVKAAVRVMIATGMTLVGACHGCEDVRGLDFTECDQSSQCEGTSICEYGRCRPQCTTDRECAGIAEGSVCLKVKDSEGGVCVAPDETDCTYDHECPERTVCEDGVCRTTCNRTLECLDGWVCENAVCIPQELSQCGADGDVSLDGGGEEDSGEVEEDGGGDGDVDGDTDSSVIVECRGIDEVRSAAFFAQDGDRDVDYELCEVTVTLVSSLGFFIQDVAEGPALPVYEGADWTPTVSVGQVISTNVTRIGNRDGNEMITGHGPVTVHSEGNPIDPLIQDINDIDLGAFPLEEHEAELFFLPGLTVYSEPYEGWEYYNVSPLGDFLYPMLVHPEVTVALCPYAVFDLLTVVSAGYGVEGAEHVLEVFSNDAFSNVNNEHCGGTDADSGVGGDGGVDPERDAGDFMDAAALPPDGGY